MGSNVIEEYLISLGIDIDNKSLADLRKGISGVQGMVAQTEKLAPQLVKATGVISGAISGVIVSGAALVKSVADQEMAYETLGRTMFVTAGQAKAMKTALDALGKSVNEVQINPRLRAQYRQLLADSAAMMPGGDYKAIMAETQDFLFQFTRLKQEIAVGMQWIAYYIVKDLAGPLGNAKKTLKGINGYIIQNMPRITRTVATGFGYIRNIAWAVFRVLGGITKRIGEFWGALPAGGKKALLALSVALAAFAVGPVGKVAMAISGILLLLDDYFAYVGGRKNVYGEYWEKLDEILTKGGEAWKDLLKYVHAFFVWMAHSKDVDRFVRALKNAWHTLEELASVIGGMVLGGLQDLWGYLKNTGTISDFTAAIGDLADGIMTLFEGVTSLWSGFTKLLKIMRGDPHALKFWDAVKWLFKALLGILIKSVSNLGKFANIIGKLLKGDLAGAKKIMGSIHTVFDGDGTSVDLNSKELGGLSHKYEAGSPGTIGEGSGGSYGSWQIIAGNIPEFLEKYLAQSNPEYYERLKSAGPVGGAAFNDEWRAIAAEDPEGFEAVQHRYIADTHYGKQVKKILAESGVDITQMSRGVQEAVWSTAVQHGPATNIITRAIDRLGGADNIDLTEAVQKALIDAIYDVRMGYAANNEGVAPETLWARWEQERADAKAIIMREYEEKPKSAQGPTNPFHLPRTLEEARGTSVPGVGLSQDIHNAVDNWNSWSTAANRASRISQYSPAGNTGQSFVANVTINAYGTNATPEAIGRAAKQNIEAILPKRDIVQTYDRGAGVQ